MIKMPTTVSLIRECNCPDTFAMPVGGRSLGHDPLVSLAECVMMFKEHFGDDEEYPNGGEFALMIRQVAKKHGWHHVIEDINKMRSEGHIKLYLNGGFDEWSGFCNDNLQTCPECERVLDKDASKCPTCSASDYQDEPERGE